MTTKPNEPSDRQDQQDPPRKSRDGGGSDTREARLKAALKANMARRKEQARARAKAEIHSADTNNKE